MTTTMTTINNDQSLIEKVGGIERAREIVDGAPTQDCFYDTYEGLFYSKDHDHYWEWWDSDCKEWFECEFVVNQNEDGFLHLNDLRTAIAKHDSREFKVGDLVVLLTLALGNSYLWNVVNTDECMIEISQIGQKNEWVHFLEIKHASPSEIKAGHRLEAERHG